MAPIMGVCLLLFHSVAIKLKFQVCFFLHLLFSFLIFVYSCFQKNFLTIIYELSVCDICYLYPTFFIHAFSLKKAKLVGGFLFDFSFHLFSLFVRMQAFLL